MMKQFLDVIMEFFRDDLSVEVSVNEQISQ